MTDSPHPTPYPYVNAVLHGFATDLQALLGDRFRGLYLSGSLALGDFDPQTSDIDFIVLTDPRLSYTLIDAVRDLHNNFNNSDSPWAGKIEAVYITPEALHTGPISSASYPQVEKDRPLFVEPLESGWIYHLYTLREHPITVAGSPVSPLIGPIDPDDMRRAAAPVATTWLEQAHHDPTWLEWISEQKYQAFVILTLCRLLYTLETGSVTSKPAAARWATGELGSHRAPLIERALSGQHSHAKTPQSDIDSTIEMVEYTVDRFQRWQNT